MSTALKTVDAFVLDRCGALAGGGYTPYFVFVPDIKMMQPLVQRKPAFGQSIESTASPASYGRGMISKEKNEELKEGNSASKPSEKYDKLRNLLLCGMSIPLAVLFAYGGTHLSSVTCFIP